MRSSLLLNWAVVVAALALLPALAAGQTTQPSGLPSVLAPGATVRELATGFKFTEGPVADKDGNVYFTDIPASRIYKWSPDGGAVVFRENSGGANGLAIDAAGRLLACEGGNGRVTATDANGQVEVIADKYDGKRFNQPNDLWIDPNGGVYFSDPKYGKGERPQGSECVYYVSPDRSRVIRVIDDMVRPNGIVGTPDGRTLYVGDHGGGKVFRYSINADATLAGKTLVASEASDGMKLDRAGNLYLTTDAVLVFSPAGKQIARIEVPQRPANICFAGKDGKTLFITACKAVYAVESAIGGVVGGAGGR